MNKNRKTSHILNVFQYDNDGHVVLPASLTLTVAPASNDNSGKVGTTAWVRSYVTGLNYLTAGSTSTSDISEGTNLYYTTSRFDTRLATKTTTDLAEGTRLYYTDTRVGTYLTNNNYATQSYVTTQIANLVDAAPGTLDTLNELAAALGDDPNFATSVATSIGTKQAQLNGTGFVKISGTTISYDNSTYLTSFTETDPIYVASSWYSTTNNASNWNTAYGWGNHASAGYLTTSSASSTYLTSATAATTYASLTGAYANPVFVSSLAYSKITGVPAFLTSYTETDPYRVTSVAVSGTSTKTITLTRADSSTVTTTWTDIDTDTNTYVTSAGFSGGNLTLTRNDTGQITVSLDGRYYLATNPSGYITGITSGQVTGALGFTPVTSARTITINGTAYDLSADRSWSISASTAWSSISAGQRENYDLGFRPADNLSSYAGFRFGSPSNDGNAGYLLVRGGADNDVYTQNGLTIVADLGWLTLAQRTTASKGVRIMTGSSTSTTRVSITDSYSTFSNNIKFAGSTNNAYLGSSDWGFRVTNDNGYIQFGPANNSWSHIYSDKSFYFNQELYVSGQQVIHSGNIGSQSVSYASTAGIASAAQNSSFLTQANATWGARIQLGGNGDPGANSALAVVQATDGNLHMDCGTGKSMYLNYYRNGTIYLNGSTYSISSNGSYYNGTSSYSNNSGALNGWGYSSYAYRSSGTGYYQIDTWLQANGNFGIYWPSYYGLHLYPNNDGSYGSLQVKGTKNSWHGIHFDSGTALMMNSNESGHHREGYGWQYRWSNGVFYISTNSYGGGSEYTAIHSGNIGSQTVSRANGALKLWAESHPNDYYIVNNWTGSHWRLTSNHGSPVRVGYSDDTGAINSAVGNAYYWSGIQYFETNNGGSAVNNSNSAKLEAYSSSNNTAFMSFHRGGYYAINMGLDNDNVFRIGGWSASGNRFQMDMSGNLTMAGDVTAYSDARVKENIVTVDNALNKVLALRGVYYNRIDSDDKKTKLGVIAQEILQTVPEVVNQDNDGMFNVSYGNLAGLFIEAFKEQQKQIEELKSIIYGLTR